MPQWMCLVHIIYFFPLSYKVLGKQQTPKNFALIFCQDVISKECVNFTSVRVLGNVSMAFTILRAVFTVRDTHISCALH